MDTRIQNELNAIRVRRGVGAADLARRVGVSRQTIYAIEAGSFVPNTEVTLKLARELEVRVEELFALVAEVGVPVAVPTEVLSAQAVGAGQAVRVCFAGERRVSIPVHASPYYLPEADGVLSRDGELVAFAAEEGGGKKLALAGCDPAIGLLARMVEKLSGVEIVPVGASSKLALTWLVEGRVHIAGSHLEDAETGEFNLPYLRRTYPGEDLAVVSFARWEEGWVTAPGNPLGIRGVADLERARFVNRELGAGSRGVLDRLLGDVGMVSEQVSGYERVGYGHLAVAYLVYTGEADCCLATRAAARAFQLDFVPVQSERYDFVMNRQWVDTPAAQSFLDVLQRANLRRKLEVLAGYDTARTGAVLA